MAISSYNFQFASNMRLYFIKNKRAAINKSNVKQELKENNLQQEWRNEILRLFDNNRNLDV